MLLSVLVPLSSLIPVHRPGQIVIHDRQFARASPYEKPKQPPGKRASRQKNHVVQYEHGSALSCMHIGDNRACRRASGY